MKLGFPKSRLGWKFVGIYLIFLIYVLWTFINSPFDDHFLSSPTGDRMLMLWTYPWNLISKIRAFNNLFYIIPQAAYLALLLLFTPIPNILILYWLGKRVEILFQKLRGAKVNGKK